MCGILGAHGTSQQTVEKNLPLLAHRGPDHRGIVQAGNMILGHTRLAIVDVEHGQQPLRSTDGRYWLINNGEIYNHEDLREQYPDYDFQTDSDNEVLLPLFAEHGVAMLDQLNGMFAMAVYDTQEDRLFLARDPIGIKPLYYGWRGETFYFSSEMKSIDGIVDEMHELGPGQYYDNGHIARYYDIDDLKQRAQEHPATIADVREALVQAVHRRLMSDVPLGVYLSGGLDSTIVASIVAQVKPDVHSFAVGVEGSEDIQQARKAAEALGTNHHEYIYTAEEILDALSDIIYHLESFDPTLVRSAIPNYFLAKMTRQYVTVVLTGEGADELYAGYHYLKEFDHDALDDELVGLLANLYNCNLQRCDRMTMAHSIEARVPFLDVNFIEVSMRVPHADKIHPETQVEKYALRRAFEDILPENVAWRRKEQFSHGAGGNHLMEDLAERRYTDAAFAQCQGEVLAEAGIEITSKEMLLYYDEFHRSFSQTSRGLIRLWRGHDMA